MKKQFLSILFVSLFSLSLASCEKESEPGDVEKVFEKTVFSYKYSDVVANYYSKKSCIPSFGSPNLLVLPVYFSDSGDFVPIDKLEIVRDDLNKAFFGAPSEVGWHSVRTFYATESISECLLSGVVAEPYVVSDSYLNYGQESINTKLKTEQLIVNATDNYFISTGASRALFDLDNNGYLDGVVLIYIAPDYSNFEDSLNKENLWAYTNWINNNADVSSPVVCNYMWASYDFIYSKDDAISKFGDAYGFGSGDTTFVSLDTHRYIHEVGHMFGLLDYYDYSSYRYKPAGGFSMQDYNIGGHDPFSTMALGWTHPFIPTESMTIELKDFQTSNQVILLSNHMNEDNSPFDEYFLLEYFSPTGLNMMDAEHPYLGEYPIATNQRGIRLWHVDARLIYSEGSSFSSTKITTKPDISGCKVLEMMSNSYYSAQSTAYISRLGSSYADFNILQLIRNDELETYRPSSSIDKFSLFKKGDSFSIKRLKNQFKRNGKLNSGDDFDWSFSVLETGDTASIAIKKINY